MVDVAIVTSVRKYLHELQAEGIDVRFGVIFGSWATGKAGQWSDIDLLVVSPRFDGSFPRQDVDLLWCVAARTDSRIEPIPCGQKQWEEGTDSAVVEIARRQGEQVAA
jgi:hypothetical protein